MMALSSLKDQSLVSATRCNGIHRQEAQEKSLMGVLSSLDIVPLERILLHEDHDTTRASPLINAVKRDGLQRHPVIVMRDQTGSLIHLDGANRITALKHLGCRHIVAQILDYTSSTAVSLDTWMHMVHIEPEKLLASALTWPNCRLESIFPDEAAKLLDEERAVAVVHFANGKCFAVRSKHGLANRTIALRRLTGQYTTSPIRETCPQEQLIREIQKLLACMPQANAGVAFAPLRKTDVITLVSNLQMRLPPGITRFLVTCGRILHVNAPIELLQSNCSSTKKREVLQTRLSGQRCRFYSEPTIQIEEY